MFVAFRDQRAQLELAVDKVLQVLNHRQLLAIERPEREEMTIEEANEVSFYLLLNVILCTSSKYSK
jgi:hypothetical protein